MSVADKAEAFDLIAVKALAQPTTSAIPHVEIGVPDLGVYDELITMTGAA